MKKILSLILLSICSISLSQCEPGDWTNIIWSSSIDPIECQGLFYYSEEGCVNPTYEQCINESDLILWNGYECCCEANYWNGCSISIEENELDLTNGLYIDLLGRVYKEQPIGLSIMNGVKYYKF